MGRQAMSNRAEVVLPAAVDSCLRSYTVSAGGSRQRGISCTAPLKAEMMI